MVKSTITCDMEGVIETYNEGAQSIFGRDAAAVIGHAEQQVVGHFGLDLRLHDHFAIRR